MFFLIKTACSYCNKSFCCSQLFWEKKLSGLNAYDIAEELVKTMELPKGLQGKSHKFSIVRQTKQREAEFAGDYTFEIGGLSFIYIGLSSCDHSV